MTALTIREVPDTTVTRLKVKAAQSGQSLQAYLLELVTRDAATPKLSEMMDRLDRETRTDVSTSDIVAAVEEGRAHR
jgi:plasmid stability protein